MTDYRDFVMSLVEDGLFDERFLLVACLKYMSQDDVKGMIEANGLDPYLADYREVYGIEEVA